MKALKPYQDEIKEKFADNKDMLNRATAKLFEDANQNPLAGCLISILQLPILIGLYRSITLLAKDGQLQEPFLWIPSLEGPVTAPTYRGMEWLTQGWVDGVPSLGWETTLAFLIMPVLLVLGQSVSMKVLTPNTTDDENMSAEEKEQAEKTQGFLKFLPLLIGYFSLQVPAGLTIYWFTSNLYQLSQSLAVKGYYKANPPQIELPDYWDALDDVASMSPEERRKAAEAGVAVGPKWEDIMDGTLV
jgi:YidC/Oxa1 family membrane protein insertase